MKKMGMVFLCLALAFGISAAQASTYVLGGGSSSEALGDWAGNGQIYPLAFNASAPGGVDIVFYGIDGSQLQFNNINWGGEIKGTGIAGVTSGIEITSIDPSNNSVWSNMLNQNTPSSVDWNGMGTSTLGPDGLPLTSDDTRSWLFQSWYRPSTGGKTGHPGYGDPAYNTESYLTPNPRHPSALPNTASFFNKFDMRLRITPSGSNYIAERWVRMHNSAASVEGAYWVFNAAMNNSADAWRRCENEAGVYTFPMTNLDLTFVHPFVGVANWTTPAAQTISWDSVMVTGSPSAYSVVWVDDAWIGLVEGSPVSLPGGGTGYIGFDAFATIAGGVGGVAVGGTVNIAPGLYEEQVVVAKEGVMLLGSGTNADPAIGTIIKSPLHLAYSFSTGSPNFPIVGIHDIASATLENCRIDGLGRGNANYRFEGIAFWNAGGEVVNCYLTGVGDTPFSGNQHGVGIYAYNNTGGPYTINISGTDVVDAQKTGMALSGAGLTAHVTDCTVSGHGPTAVTAQNGIQLGSGATGSITGCEVSGLYYTGSTYMASSILLYYPASGVSLSGNNLHDTQGLNAYYADNLLMEDNAFTTNDYGFIWGGTNSTVTGNTFVTNPYGLYLEDAVTANVSGNIFTDNAYAIVSDGSCSGLTFTGNSITGSTIAAVEIDPYGTSPTGVVFTGNNISGNVFGINNTTTNMVVATGNWWGDGSGPELVTTLRGVGAITRPASANTEDGKEPGQVERVAILSAPAVQSVNPKDQALVPTILGTGDGVSTLVDYSPWWGANYVGDTHSSTWNWFLDTSNSSSIQEAVDLVTTGDSVYVLPDIYSGVGNRDIDFAGKNIKLFSTAGLASTIIDCGAAGRAFNFHSGENSSAIVNGFTIKNGSASGNGGAILCQSSSTPTIAACLIFNNHATGDGGAVYCDNSNVNLLGNTIAANKADGNGGGLAINNSNPIVLNTILWQDTATSEIYLSGGAPNVRYSDIQGGWSGEGNINCEPQFCGPDAGNFHISDASCCLTAGLGGVKIGALESDCIGHYYITASAGINGIIDPSGTISALHHSDQTFNITPDLHYHVADVLIDGVSVGPVPSYTFYDVSDNHTIEASFAIDRFTITASSSLNGSIDPVGEIVFDYGSSQIYTMTPILGYHVADVTVDGGSVGPVPSYTFSDISSDHTINVTFAIDTFIITASAGAHGVISPFGDVSVNYGADQEFTITPDSGYHVTSILVDGIPVGAILSVTFTFNNVTADHTIEVIFAVDVFTINASAGAHGSIIPSGIIYLDWGMDTTFTITPAFGYQVANVLVDDISVGSRTSYTFTDLSASHTISASFEVAFELPVITSVPSTSGTLGHYYSYDVEATGIPTPTYSLTLFPIGMTIDPITGLIEWTPIDNGDYGVRVVASNAAGSDFQEFVIEVGGCNYVVGDVNGSHTFTGLDVVFSVNYFKGGPLPPYYCECTSGHGWFVAGDVNASCSFSGLDVTYMVRYFKGGEGPHPCPDCPPALTGILKAHSSTLQSATEAK